MDRGGLHDLATGFVHRKDIPWDLVQPLADADINITLVVQENEASANLLLSGPDNKSLYAGALPTNYARMRSVWQNGIVNPVDIKSLQEFRVRRYAISGGQLYSRQATACDIVYSARLSLGPADTDTNPVLENYPNVVLYALLKHAAIWMQDAELNKEFFETQFLSAAQTANSNYEDATFGPGRAALAMGGPI